MSLFCRRAFFGLLLALGVTAMVPVASAQSGSPDLRAIRPAVMLLVDTSGSMEYLPTAGRNTAGAANITPDCSVAAPTRNRWSTLLESLTGTYSTYACTRWVRTAPAFAATYGGAAYDRGYYIPYHQPTGVQNTDGILDVYMDRVKFGVMTFDSAATILGGDELVPQAVFQGGGFLAQSAGEPGMYSYGANRPLVFPGCPTTYMVNLGSRSSVTSLGGLVSTGNETSDYRAINAAIQSNLMSVRPFGRTPIAPMLDDARNWLNTNTDVANPATITGADPFYQCRDRYMILLTDGAPDGDFRSDGSGRGFSCDQPRTNPAHPLTQCPYDRAPVIAADLCRYDAGTAKCTGNVKGVFVVGFDVSGSSDVAQLNDIASAGGTSAAFFANDRASLMATLSNVLDRAATSVTTRTAPAFANVVGASAGTPVQMQFNTGFRVGNTTTPWAGVLERQRYECVNGNPVARPLDDARGDRFHVRLNTQADRDLSTVVPSTPANRTGWLVGNGIDASLTTIGFPAAPAETNLALTRDSFRGDNSTITPAMLGVATAADRDAVISWVLADAAAPLGRQQNRLGDIYYSSPVAVSRPLSDIADESFNAFRNRADVAGRPTVVYVGTNDGILHAFVAQDWTSSDGTRSYVAGHELWGFVPPALLGRLDTARNSKQSLVDGTPIVRDVYFRKTSGGAASGNNYHTVLLLGLRGVPTYEALDVTDPLNPKLLWQYTGPNMGLTIGQPALGQVLVNAAGGPEERAIAVLPGGTGAQVASASGCTYTGPRPTTTGIGAARTNTRCWAPTGRNLTIMDVGTGRPIRVFDETTFSAPLVGAVSLFTGDVGTVATRAFFTDADGIVWRLDMSSPDPTAWSVRRFHDIFWDGAWDAGQPAQSAPVLSTDASGRVVLLQATGDISVLDGAAANRVVSVTEVIARNAAGAQTGVNALMNWEVRLAAGEQVTGPLDLFNGVVYFGTFASLVNPGDACQFGSSRLWGLDYVNRSAVAVGPTFPGAPALRTPASATPVSFLGPYPNQIIMGVGVTQRPDCTTTNESVSAFGGVTSRITSRGGVDSGAFQLVAQLSSPSGATPVAGGSAIQQIAVTVTPPAAFTRVVGYSGTVD